MVSNQKHVVVTGAGRGLGRGVAQAFAKNGWHVWINSEVPDELESTERAIRERGGLVTSVCADLGDLEGCSRLVESLRENSVNLRAVVNNAAVLNLATIENTSPEDWSRTLAVNLTAPFFVTRGLLPCFAEGGSIINVSSRAGVDPFAQEGSYCASKFGLEALSRCLALELQDRPISVNTITPGAKIKPTSITDREASTVPDAQRGDWVDPTTLGPAFTFLADLRGEVSGRRFNAATLVASIQRIGSEKTFEQIETLYE